MQTKNHTILRILAFMAVCFSILSSCEKEAAELPDPEIFTKVNILYSAGHNDLTTYLQDDMEELAGSAIKSWDHPNEAFIIFSHFAKGRYDYSLVEPKLTRVRAKNGQAIYETLKNYPKETNSAATETFNEVLRYIRDRFPAKEYNLIFSSHCSGYLPAGYLGNSAEMEAGYDGDGSPFRQQRTAAKPYPAPGHIAGPLTKGIGADYVGSSSNSYEIDLTDFAGAIPMKFNAIIFDACFMGGIEVAYELKDKCRYLVASPAEILAEGMAYTRMGARIFGSATDVQGLATDYFDQYKEDNSGNSGATVSVIDCTMLEPLAEICSKLFESGRQMINEELDHRNIQRFYRKGTGHYHGFYDLRDILVKAGCSEEELSGFDAALDGCVIYKAATDKFLNKKPDWGGFDVTTYCGFSMYLPSHTGTYGNAYLNDYYKGLAWNKATGLVK